MKKETQLVFIILGFIVLTVGLSISSFTLGKYQDPQSQGASQGFLIVSAFGILGVSIYYIVLNESKINIQYFTDLLTS